MRIQSLLFRGVAASALLALTATGAIAESKSDQAKKAISAAQAKIDAAAKVGAAGNSPHMLADAQASLRAASQDLGRGRKDDAIAEANHAETLADTALNLVERDKQNAAVAAQAQSANAVANAQQSAAEANSRAESAERNAAAAAADANAARNQPPVIIAAPTPAPQPTTTVVEQTEASTPAIRTSTRSTVAHRRVVKHRVVHHATTKPSTVKKTTTITTTQ